MKAHHRDAETGEHAWVTGGRWISGAAAVLGLALLGGGTAAVFISQNDVGSGAMLTLGGLMFLLGAMGDRLASLRYGDLEIVLRRKAEEARKGGDPETAQALQFAADKIGARVKHIGGAYRNLRSSMPAGPERTARMEQIIREARADAHEAALDEERVLALLWTGSEGARVWALGVLQERPELATVRSVLEAVTRPDQMFDQYQALIMAERHASLPDVRPWTRERIQKAVRDQLEAGALGSDRDCLAVAHRILT